MRSGVFLLALLSVAVAAAAAWAEDVAPRAFDLAATQGYVANWAPQGEPFCAVLRSAADWKATIRPAATMGSSRPFEPPADSWTRSALFVVARVTYATQGEALAVTGLRNTREGLEIDTRFAPPAPASYTVKTTAAVELEKPLPQKILVRENGAVVCALEPAKGRWRQVGR